MHSWCDSFDMFNVCHKKKQISWVFSCLSVFLPGVLVTIVYIAFHNHWNIMIKLTPLACLRKMSNNCSLAGHVIYLCFVCHPWLQTIVQRGKGVWQKSTVPSGEGEGGLTKCNTFWGGEGDLTKSIVPSSDGEWVWKRVQYPLGRGRGSDKVQYPLGRGRGSDKE